MDISKAHEVEQGLLVENGPFYTGGTASPVGLDLPTGAFYLQDTTTGVKIWRKFGSTTSEWRELSAQDIPFDVSGLTNRSPDLTGLTQTQEVVSALSERNFGTNFAVARSNPNFITTSPTFVDALVINIPNAAQGRYIVHWSYRANVSKQNTSSEHEPRFNNLALTTNSTVGTSAQDLPLGGTLGEQFTGFAEFSILALANLKISLAVRLTAGNGNVRLNTMNLFCYRLEYA